MDGASGSVFPTGVSTTPAAGDQPEPNVKGISALFVQQQPSEAQSAQQERERNDDFTPGQDTGRLQGISASNDGSNRVCNLPSSLKQQSLLNSIHHPESSSSRAGPSQPSQTQQTEILTQNPDWSQLGDFEDDEEEPFSPSTRNKRTPWGRLMPCAGAGNEDNASVREVDRRLSAAVPIDLFPRPPEDYQDMNGVGIGVTWQGITNLHAADVFNEYTVGRSTKCDVTVVKPDAEEADNNNKKKKGKAAASKWTYGMISNRHCRIYCTLDSSSASGIAAYVEDTSGNGTVVNKTTMLRRGCKRRLHSGDEICLVNPETLQKKIRNQKRLRTLLAERSYVFIMLQPQPQRQSLMQAAAILSGGQPSRYSPRTSSSKRKSAVDARATRQHSWQRPAPRQPAPTNQQSALPKPRQAAKEASVRKFPAVALRRRSFLEGRRIEEEYDIRDMLGSGTVGTVRRAIHRKSGIERAVKVIALEQQKRGTLMRRGSDFSVACQALETEASLLQQLEHPYVVQLLDVFISPEAVYLVMPYLPGGDLLDRIVERGKYNEVNSRRVMRRLLSAVHYLHNNNIVHRDLKPENTLLLSRDNDIDVKLTDFGLAKTCAGAEGLQTFCGTPQYFAPEVLRNRLTVHGQGTYGKPADMWSLGVCLYILLSGTPPFDVGVFDSFIDARITFPDEHWEGVSEEAKDLVLKLLQTDPKQRLTVQQACQHAWIMMADGDTHVYPLDDPNVSVSKKRLFVATSNTPPPPAYSEPLSEIDSRVIPGPKEAKNSRNEDNDTDKPLRPHISPVNGMEFNHGDASTLTEQGNSLSLVLREASSSSSSRSTLMKDDHVDDEDDDDDGVDAELSAFALSTEKASNFETKPLEATAARSSTPLVERQSDVHPKQEQPRCPLSPVSLNERHNEFRDQILLAASTGKKNAVDEASCGLPEPVGLATDAKDSAQRNPTVKTKNRRGAMDESLSPTERSTTDHDRSLLNAETPAVSNKDTSYVAVVDQAPQSKAKAEKRELIEDEILSQFSEKTESIQSFSDETTAASTMSKEPLTAAVLEPTRGSAGAENTASVGTPSEKSKMSKQSNAKRKRRVTDSSHKETLAEGATNNKRTKVSSNTSTGRSRKRGKGSAGESKAKANEAACSNATKKATGGKQTKLSTFFKKTNA